VAFVCCVVAIALAAFHLYVALFGTPETRSFRSTHLSGMLVLAVLLNPLFRGSLWEPLTRPGDPGNARRVLGFAVDVGLVLLGIGIQAYTLYDIDMFVVRMGNLRLS